MYKKLLVLPPLRQHDLVDEIDDGNRRLFWVQLCEEVTDVLCHAAGLLGYKSKNP